MTYYNPTCGWCGEQENDEQGAVELVGPDGYYHDDCYTTYLDRLDLFEDKFRKENAR